MTLLADQRPPHNHLVDQCSCCEHQSFLRCCRTTCILHAWVQNQDAKDRDGTIVADAVQEGGIPQNTTVVGVAIFQSGKALQALWNGLSGRPRAR